jgi:hypothetical protein
MLIRSLRSPSANFTAVGFGLLAIIIFFLKWLFCL